MGVHAKGGDGGVVVAAPTRELGKAGGRRGERDEKGREAKWVTQEEEREEREVERE